MHDNEIIDGLIRDWIKIKNKGECDDVTAAILTLANVFRGVISVCTYKGDE